MSYPPETPPSTYPPEPTPRFPPNPPASQYPSPPSTYPTPPTPPPPGFESDPGSAASSTELAKDQASQVGDTAAQAGAQVAGAAKEQAANVAEQAKSEAKNLLGQTREELNSQAGTQQQRVAGGLRSLSSELQAMADGTDSGRGGPAHQAARQAAERISTAASWLADREPGQVLTEVQRFARQRPGTFLALAAVAGLAAGRLTRGLAADSQPDSQAESSSALPDSLPVEGSADPWRNAEDAPHSMTDPVPAYGTAMPPVGSGQGFDAPAPASPEWPQGPSPILDDSGYRDPNTGRIGQ